MRLRPRIAQSALSPANSAVQSSCSISSRAISRSSSAISFHSYGQGICPSEKVCPPGQWIVPMFRLYGAEFMTANGRLRPIRLTSLGFKRVAEAKRNCDDQAPRSRSARAPLLESNAGSLAGHTHSHYFSVACKNVPLWHMPRHVILPRLPLNQCGVPSGASSPSPRSGDRWSGPRGRFARFDASWTSRRPSARAAGSIRWTSCAA